MKLQKYAMLAASLAILFSAEPISAQESPAKELPTGAVVLDAYIQATGGAKAYKNVKSAHVKGTFSMPAQGIGGDLEIFVSAPNKMYMSISLGKFGAIQTGTNGKVAWEISPMTGTRLLKGKELSNFLKDAEFTKEVNWRKFYKSVKVVGKKKVNGEDSYQLEMISTDGDPEIRYYGIKSKYLLRIKKKQRTQMGELPVSVDFSEYKKDGALISPRKQTITAMGATQVLTFESSQVNIKIPAKRFALPDAVKKLLAK